MRDIKLMKLNERGQASFGIFFNSIEGIDVLVQKVISLLLSNTKETYFGSVTGSNLLDTGKYTFGDNGNADFKAQLSSDISLISKKIKSKYLDGSITAKERLKLVEEFNESIEPQVFLISLKAGGTGLNLTSAKFVMHMDPWWNPAIEDQATDRAHRIGQKDIVEVIKLIAKDTIEENIIKLQEDKREIVNSVISDESLNINNISKLTNEEILDLFK